MLAGVSLPGREKGLTVGARQNVAIGPPVTRGHSSGMGPHNINKIH